MVRWHHQLPIELENEEMQPKTPAWERTGRILLPALSLIAFIVAQVMGKYARLSWLLIVLTVVFVVSGYHAEIQASYGRWKERRDNQRAVDKAYPQFRDLVGRFGPFIDNRTNDTLHYMMRELCQTLPDVRLIQFPDMELWSGPWMYFWQRLDRQRMTMDEFRPAWMEFHFMVATYCSYCVRPIFENPPHGFHATIPPGAKSKLNLFQQKLVRYLGEYQDFSKTVSESRPSLNGLPMYCVMPSPIP
jgi:hypothetical protein